MTRTFGTSSRARMQAALSQAETSLCCSLVLYRLWCYIGIGKENGSYYNGDIYIYMYMYL